MHISTAGSSGQIMVAGAGHAALQLTATAERKDLHQNSMAHRTVKARAER